MAGRSAVDADGGAGFNESGDGACDRGLFGCPGRRTGAVGGGAADYRATVNPVELPSLVELGEVTPDGHAGHTEPLRQLGDVHLTRLLQRLQDVALTSAPCILRTAVLLRHAGKATGQRDGLPS